MTSTMATPGSGQPGEHARVTDKTWHCQNLIHVVMDARYISAKVVQEVINNHKHLDQVLAVQLEPVKDPREKGLARELSYGIMRWYLRLTFIANLMLKKPLKAKDNDVLALICSGLYQLGYLRIPDHAAISATVESARTLGKPWACELINAILRRYQREKLSIEKKISESDSALFSHPEWMISQFRTTWPSHWQEILDSNNKYPPLQLRVNLQKQSRTEYLQRLQQVGIDADPSSIVSSGITLSKPVNVEEIPGFLSGDVSVQDYGAQLAVSLLNATTGHRVLDACAAPGGKTGHILENTPDLEELVAVESDPYRMELLRNTVHRLKLNVNLVHADVNDVDNWWDGKPFDRILLDAPCSATGVIRRHPDIKLLRTPEQMQLFTGTQIRLLDSVWPLLKQGGQLLYSTCSILKAEADDQIASFSNKYDDTEIIPIQSNWGISSEFGRYILPGHEQTDGFFYALITKISGS